MRTENESAVYLHTKRLQRYKRNLRKYDKRANYVGTSLSGCVEDMLAGFMPFKNVIGIVANTAITSVTDWEKWRDGYSHWAHKLTSEPYSKAEWDKVFDHIMFNCVFIQHRVSWGEWNYRRSHRLSHHTQPAETNPWAATISAPRWVSVREKELRYWEGGIRNLVRASLHETGGDGPRAAHKMGRPHGAATKHKVAKEKIVLDVGDRIHTLPPLPSAE